MFWCLCVHLKDNVSLINMSKIMVETIENLDNTFSMQVIVIHLL